MQRMRPNPETASPDAGQDRDRAPSAGPATDAGTDLQRMRHRARMALGVIAALGLYAVAAVVATRPFGPAAVVAVAAAGAASLAAGRLVTRRIAAIADTASPEHEAVDETVDVPLVVIAVAAGVVYAVVAQFGEPAPFRDVPDDAPASWFAVPAVANIAVVVALAGRRWIVGALLGGLVATMVAATAHVAIAGDLPWGWFAVEGALVAGVGIAGRAELRDWELVVRLERARRLEGELAVAEERLRFAADLHDIQGHHLQVIALKSELATRLAASDPAAAATNMAQVGDHARQALADTRSVVQGYRRASLGAELANATRVFAAAGIDGRLDRAAQGAADGVGEPGRHLLGLVVREATTNVLRHSHADQARLALTVDDDTARLQVRNNGATATDEAASHGGTGLATLADRLRAAGGALEWRHDDDWFTVTARMPAGQGQLP